MTVPLNFVTLLHDADLPVSTTRLLRHTYTGARAGFTPYELWINDRLKFDYYQSRHTESAHRKLRSSSHWAAFVANSQGNTMFVGCYSVRYAGTTTDDTHFLTDNSRHPAGTIHSYAVLPSEALKEYSERLFIDWPVPLAWVQRANGVKPIAELLREAHVPPFPGFLEFVQPLSAIAGLPETWHTALRSMRGIYLLACPRTNEHYVGSAYGTGGFLERWLGYAVNMHGGNVGLQSREPSDYQVSILEAIGTSASLDDILYRENLWKTKLLSRTLGLNRN
jgi:hypothetical protein